MTAKKPGSTYPQRQPSRKAEIVRAALEHPDWTRRQIAAAVGVHIQIVTRMNHACALNIPRSKNGRPPRNGSTP